MSFIAMICCSISVNADTDYQEPISFTAFSDSGIEGSKMTLQHCWSVKINDMTPLGYSPKSIAVKDGIIYLPENTPMRDGSYDPDSYIYSYVSEIRRYDAMTGERLNNVKINLPSDVIDELDGLWASGLIYLINDSAGNLVVVFDLGYGGAGDTKNYSVCYGLYDLDKATIEVIKKVGVSLGTNNKYKWGFMGCPNITGDVETGEYEMLVPITYRNYNDKIYTADYFGGIAEISGNNEGKTVSLNKFSNQIVVGVRGTVDVLSGGYLIYDNCLHTPALMHRADNDYAPSANILGEGINSVTKGMKLFEYAGFKFIINGTEDGDFRLYNVKNELPEYVGGEEMGLTLSHCSLMTINGEPKDDIEAMAGVLADTSQNSYDDPSWSLSTTSKSLYGNDTEDIHLYRPGQYLTTYRLGTDDKFTGTDNVSIDNIKYNEPDYYNLQGMEIGARPEKPGVYLMRSGNSVKKVIIR